MPTKKEQTADPKPKKKTAAKSASKSSTTSAATASDSPAAAAPARKRATKKPEAQPAPNAHEDSAASESGHSSVPMIGAHAPIHEPEITAEHIAVRAYFLAEDRHAAGQPGDHATDWLEAERQLRAEAQAIAASLGRIS